MTKKQAKKKLSFEVWEYLRDHPEIKRKACLPEKLFNKIIEFIHLCPLCHIFYDYTGICCKCPLESCLVGTIYSKWLIAKQTMREKNTPE